MLENTSCPKCGAPIVSVGVSVLIEKCSYCGSTFRTVVKADKPLVCGCGRPGVNHCAKCTVALCEQCSNCIEHFDLNNILMGHGVHPRHHARLIDQLARSVRLSATLCVPCLDTTLGDWLRTTTTNP